MKKISAPKANLVKINLHEHICDLIRLDVPLLSLYSDGRRNWLYLWCDTNGEDGNRWWIFTASRGDLADYLSGKSSLLKLLESTERQYILDNRVKYEFDENYKATITHTSRRLYVVVPQELVDYLPSENSYFDPELTEDIELAEELVPKRFDVPIDGVWFSKDFQHLFKTYENLYAFFYSTRPRFVKTAMRRLGDALHAPWRGGHSRVNMYASLSRAIPAQHSLRVRQMNYASPGEVEFEALPSVGESIKSATLRLVGQLTEIGSAISKVRQSITTERLNKADLSSVDDKSLGVDEGTIVLIKTECDLIATMLGMTVEFSVLSNLSPNTIVFGKAVSSVVKQLERLAVLETEDMLKLGREQRVQAASTIESPSHFLP